MDAVAASRSMLEGVAGGVGSATPKPFDIQQVTLSRREYIELVGQAKQYKGLHARAVERIQRIEQQHGKVLEQMRAREQALVAELELARAQLRGLRRQVFGTRTERAKSLRRGDAGAVGPRRPRGQVRGRPGHGRTRVTGLPTEIQELTTATACPQCGGALVEIPGTQDAEVLEIEVKAYRRVIRRHRYRPSCRCGRLPGLVVPAPPPQLIQRGKLGVSIWVEALLSKFYYGQPTHRLLRDWRDQGLLVAAGTLTGGLQALLPLFMPLVAAGRERLRQADHWHADETRWEVFEAHPGKVGHRWYLWVFKSAQVVCMVLDPSRSAEVPRLTLGEQARGLLSVDRYAAYRKFAGVATGVELSLCWAHQRRDFLELANRSPEHWSWAVEWVDQIGQLYALHEQRRALAREPFSAAYLEQDRCLRAQVAVLQARWETELADAEQAPSVHKLLRTMRLYWPGLILFLDHPWLDLDNNVAERALRPAVVGRKNFYGSGSAWSGQLAAAMMSLLATAELWQLNPRTWLTAYLHACAAAGGKPPADCAPFLPWAMSGEQRADLARADTS